MGLGGIALLMSLWSGLARLGWNLLSFPQLTLAHGGLIVNGFLGVLIPLERAVALRRQWMFLAPLLCGVGWIVWFFFPVGGKFLFLLGSMGMVAILSVMFKREPQLHTATMMAGGMSWVLGNLLWLMGRAIFEVVLFWIAFLVLTIGGERLELNRVLRLSKRQQALFKGWIGLLVFAALLSILYLDWGARFSGISYLLLFGWFLQKDLAFRNLRHPQSLTRFISIALASGFLWLGIGGLFFVFVGKTVAGPFYDAALHSLFVGFVGSMIFGHAPIIFPSLFGLTARFSKALYLPLALLHLSLILRLVGDITFRVELRQWGGLFNIVAALVYLGLTARLYLKGKS